MKQPEIVCEVEREGERINVQNIDRKELREIMIEKKKQIEKMIWENEEK